MHTRKTFRHILLFTGVFWSLLRPSSVCRTMVQTITQTAQLQPPYITVNISSALCGYNVSYYVTAKTYIKLNVFMLLLSCWLSEESYSDT